MYKIVKISDTCWRCKVQIQDGTECWDLNDRQEAIYSVIRNARALNGTYITESDIIILDKDDENWAEQLENWGEKLLDKIRRGEKVVLDHDDPRVKYRLTSDELDMVIKVREGELVVSERK